MRDLGLYISFKNLKTLKNLMILNETKYSKARKGRLTLIISFKKNGIETKRSGNNDAKSEVHPFLCKI